MGISIYISPPLLALSEVEGVEEDKGEGDLSFYSVYSKPD